MKILHKLAFAKSVLTHLFISKPMREPAPPAFVVTFHDLEYWDYIILIIHLTIQQTTPISICVLSFWTQFVDYIFPPRIFKSYQQRFRTTYHYNVHESYMWLHKYANSLVSNYFCCFLVHCTAPPAETTSSGAEQAVVTESWTPSVDLVITTANHDATNSYAGQRTTTESSTGVMTISPPVTAANGFIVEPTHEKKPSFQQRPCTLAAASTSLETCGPSQPTADTNSSLADQIKSFLLDDDLATCMIPFLSQSRLRLAVDTQETQASSLLRIQVAGYGLACEHPITQVYIDIGTTPGQGLSLAKYRKRNVSLCPVALSESYWSAFTSVSHSAPCNGSARFGVQFERFNWLPQSRNLEQLCDVRAFKWM